MTGKVYLVGAGPGDKELLTLKAVRVLETADVVLHDDLVSGEVLELINPLARIENVGKRCGIKSISQDEINARMIENACRGLNVVRLKSGDPLIFARAGEEIHALQKAKIPYEVVPGVTAASAAAAALKLPLTERGISSHIVFTTAHRCEAGRDLGWYGLARGDVTLVIYMPGNDYQRVARNLAQAGLTDDTPCALVSHVSRTSQLCTVATVGDFSGLSPIPAPALLIVGEVCRSLQFENLCELDRAQMPI